MAYIDTTLEEGTVMTDLAAIIVANGWTQEKTFRKISYSKALIDPENNDLDPEDPIDFAVAEHMIFKSADNALYGIAKMYKFTEYYNDVPNKPHTNSDNEDLLKIWINSNYKAFSKECTLYHYMLESLPDIAENEFFGCAVDTSLERGAIDIETQLSAFILIPGAPDPIFKYTDFNENIQQSPFAKSTLRNPNLSKTDVATNWWPDSLIRIKGFADAHTLFLIMQADNTPAFMNNVVPSVPVYWGKFESFKQGDSGNYALWVGTAYDTGNETASHSFDQKSATPYRRVADYLPIQKTYPNYPGNGVDNIIVRRSELGSRYQAYYLSWNAAPQVMPPDRVGKDGGQYPLAWTTQENDEYKYKFNPSMYSSKIHTSRAYLIHPDEGVRGYLPRMVILSPMGLVNEDKLKVRTATCPDEFDIYRFFLTSAISPVSKRPGTVYTPAGIGIYEKSI